MTEVTLHTGVASLEGDVAPYAEFFQVPAGTAEAVVATTRRGGPVILWCVGRRGDGGHGRRLQARGATH